MGRSDEIDVRSEEEDGNVQIHENEEQRKKGKRVSIRRIRATVFLGMTSFPDDLFEEEENEDEREEERRRRKRKRRKKSKFEYEMDEEWREWKRSYLARKYFIF